MHPKLFFPALLLAFGLTAIDLPAQKNNLKIYKYSIIVLGKGNQPLYDAKVAASSGEWRTSAEGEVKYESHLTWVTVSAAGYQSKKLNLSAYANGSVVTIHLSPMADEMKAIRVTVRDKNRKPVPNASVTVTPGQSAVTDGSGIGRAMHKQQPGEYVVVRVAAAGYKTQQQRVLVGVAQGNAITRPEDAVNFVLEKGENETGVFRIIVEVLDEDSNDPVKGANVTLRLSDGSEQSGSTNSKGELLLTDMEYGYEGTTGRVMVTHKDYREKWSDITADLMTAKDRDDRRFLVYVKKNAADLSGKWSITWTDPYAVYKFQWELRSSGTGYQVKHKLVSTTHPENKKLVGQSWDDITLTPAANGKFTIRRASSDSNPANPGYFEQTGSCSLTPGGLSCEGTHKGTQITHPFKIEGSRNK